MTDEGSQSKMTASTLTGQIERGPLLAGVATGLVLGIGGAVLSVAGLIYGLDLICFCLAPFTFCLVGIVYSLVSDLGRGAAAVRTRLPGSAAAALIASMLTMFLGGGLLLVIVVLFNTNALVGPIDPYFFGSRRNQLEFFGFWGSAVMAALCLYSFLYTVIGTLVAMAGSAVFSAIISRRLPKAPSKS